MSKLQGRALALVTRDSEPTSYRPGLTVREAGAESLATLLAGCRDGSIDAEYPAGVERLHAVQLTLSGGGPGSDITFLFRESDPMPDHEPVEAWFAYYDGGVSVAFRLDRADAVDVWLALNSYPEEA